MLISPVKMVSLLFSICSPQLRKHDSAPSNRQQRYQIGAAADQQIIASGAKTAI